MCARSRPWDEIGCMTWPGRQEQEEARARPDAANSLHGDAGPGSGAPDSEEGAIGSSRKILCKLAVNTGLSFFFFMLERDPEAKGFLLQSSASFLADLPPLALHAGLGCLELESLSKVQAFLEKTAAAPPGPPAGAALGSDTSTADLALSSLISFALARGSLGTDLVLARLLFASPHILKTHHLKQLRCMCTISQTWSSDASPSIPSRVRVFRPKPRSPDEVVDAWEQQVPVHVCRLCVCRRRIHSCHLGSAFKLNASRMRSWLSNMPRSAFLTTDSTGRNRCCLCSRRAFRKSGSAEKSGSPLPARCKAASTRRPSAWCSTCSPAPGAPLLRRAQ
jgi:hypothetical protein